MQQAHLNQPPSLCRMAVQSGAICWTLKQERLMILLITSRDTGRWIIPKGWSMPGKSLYRSAEIEAWEEAGVKGQVDKEALGSYIYPKQIEKNKAIAASVKVYALYVRHLASRYPEVGQRRRKWMSPKKAAAAVREPALKKLILAFGAKRQFNGEVSPW